jgi:superkiller protein 3
MRAASRSTAACCLAVLLAHRPMKLRRLALLACAFTLVASRGEAQQERFAAAVHDLARAVAGAQPATPLGPLTDRMAEGLAEWDRDIATLERRTAAELHDAADERAFQLRVERGLAYRQRGRLVDALRDFDAAAALRQTASDVHVLRGLTLEAAGQSDDAARAFQRAWSLDQQNAVKAYYLLVHGAETDRPRARTAITAAYERNLTGSPGRRNAPFHTFGIIADTWSRTPIVGDATTAEAFALLAAGKYSDAIAALRRGPSAVEGRVSSGAVVGHTASSGSESPLAHFTRARSDEAAGRVADARREYEAAAAGTLAGRTFLYIGIGRLAQVEGDLAGAVEAFRRAVQLNPNDPAGHRELAGALAADDRIDDASAELATAVLIDPSDASTLAAMGQLFLDSGRYAAAVAPLTRALQLAPDRFETHYVLATAFTHLGKSAEAARELERFERARQQMVEKRRRDIESTPPGGLR